MPAFQPYRGKPAVRNDRGDRGNVGIIRSPVRASILPDCGGRSAMSVPTAILTELPRCCRRPWSGAARRPCPPPAWSVRERCCILRAQPLGAPGQDDPFLTPILHCVCAIAALHACLSNNRAAPSVSIRRRPQGALAGSRWEMRSGSLLGGLALSGGLPVPWQQVVDPLRGMIGDAGEHVGEPRLGIDVGEFAVSINV